MLRRFRTATLAVASLGLAAVVAATLAGEWAPPPPTAPPRPPRLAIVGASIVDVRHDGRVLADHTVVVEGDRITSVAPRGSVPVPPGAHVVDGRGKYVVPGLWDSHVHTLRLSPQLHFPLLVAHGVTAVRDLGDACSWTESLDCIPSAPAWRAAIEAGTIVGPQIVEAVSYHIEDAPASPAAAADLVARLARRGERLIKVQLDPEAPAAEFARVSAAVEAAGLALGGHVPYTVDLRDPALRLASVEHDWSLMPQCSSARPFDGRPRTMPALLAGYDEARCDAVLAQLARRGTAYVPTHVASSGQDARFAAGLTPPDEILGLIVGPHRWLWAVARRGGQLDGDERASVEAFHRAALALTLRAHAAGVAVLAGSDALDPDVVHGLGLHEELAYLVQAGLTPAQALAAATVVPARQAGRLDERGTIEPGRVADLVVLDANPLEDIRHTRRIATVVAAGRVYDAATRQALVASVRVAARSWTTASRLVRGLWWDQP